MVKAGMKIYTLKSYTQKFTRIIIFINYSYPNIKNLEINLSIKVKPPIFSKRTERKYISHRGRGGGTWGMHVGPGQQQQ